MAVITTTLASADSKDVGTHATLAYEVPKDAVGEVSIVLDIPNADYIDTRNTVRATLYHQVDGVWTLGPSMGPLPLGSRVGKDGTVNPPLAFSFNVNEPLGVDFRGQSVRVDVEVFRTMRVGTNIKVTI